MDADDPLLILYTSGSTGRPKGAVLPHRQILWNAVATTTAWELTADDVAPVSTPLFHTGGWNVFATPLWHRGGTVVLLDGFDADGFLAAIEEEGCTIALTVPTQLLMLTESAALGPAPAASAPVRLRRRAVPRVAGGAGAGGGLHLSRGIRTDGVRPQLLRHLGRRGGAAARVASAGPCRSWRCGSRRTTAARRPPASRASCCCAARRCSPATCAIPEQTAATFTADGWLRTGDLAMRDADGAYRICGRRKEMYISGGENVFPAEVEAALCDCPGVAEAVVVGVPDEKWGEVGRAFVVARADALLTETEVAAHARTRLAGYKVPKSVVILPEIPRLGSGKPDRRALAALKPAAAA